MRIAVLLIIVLAVSNTVFPQDAAGESSTDPFIVSDHLCWTGLQQQNLHDLLPVPFTDEALTLIVNHVDHVQTFLRRPILLENVSTYLRFPDGDYTEWEFLRAVAERYRAANRETRGILAIDFDDLPTPESAQDHFVAGFHELRYRSDRQFAAAANGGSRCGRGRLWAGRFPVFFAGRRRRRTRRPG